MQSLFILGLFGVIYSTIAVITTMLASSSMQLKLERVDTVQQIFSEIEKGVVNGYLLEHMDFSSMAFNTNGTNRLDNTLGAADIKRLDKFVMPYVSYTSDQILMDPWGNDYFIKAATAMVTIYADNDSPSGTPNSVSAPVTAFILASAGPDRVFQTNLTMTNNYNQVRRFSTSGDNDDIIHIFTTMPAITSIWNNIKEGMDKIMAVSAEGFRQQYDLFRPVIQSDFYNRVNFYDSNYNWRGDDIVFGSGCNSTLLNSWKDHRCSISGVVGGNLTGRTGFPRFVDSSAELGIDEEIRNFSGFLVEGVELRVSNSSFGYRDLLDFEIEPSPTFDWSINYSKRLNGASIIGGF